MAALARRTRGEGRRALRGARGRRPRAQQFTFRLHPSGDGEGLGPDGVVHARFRAWKEALRDHAPA